MRLVLEPISDDVGLFDFIAGSGAAVGVVGSLLAFALVFRTSICYARWWEARCLWGLLIYASINLAQQFHSTLRQSPHLAARATSFIIVFANASLAHLRGTSLSNLSAGARLVEQGVLEEAELRDIATQTGWEPYYCLDVLRSILCKVHMPSEPGKAAASGLSGGAFQRMENTVDDLGKAIGGSIRIKACPAGKGTHTRACIVCGEHTLVCPQ